MPIYDATKRIKAEDVAAALFEWDYSAVNDEALFDALNEQGFDWDGSDWVRTDLDE